LPVAPAGRRVWGAVHHGFPRPCGLSHPRLCLVGTLCTLPLKIATDDLVLSCVCATGKGKVNATVRVVCDGFDEHDALDESS
jgi:hypothetical protein